MLEVSLTCFIYLRSGKNGIEELKAHPWFAEIDWDNIISCPAPYLPEGSSTMKPLLNKLSTIQSNTSEYSNVIREITQNFDQFQDTAPIWGGAKRSTSKLSSTGYTPLSTPKSVRKGEKNLNDEFLGYTFKRKKVTLMCYVTNGAVMSLVAMSFTSYGE